MKILHARLLAAVLLTVLTASGIASLAAAHEFEAGPLVIDHPWARATVPAAKVGGGYLTVVNSGAEPDRLVSASVGPEVAERVEIHEMSMQDGVMSMRPVEGGLQIPAGVSLKLQPGSEGGGYHLMLIGLKAQLKEGATFAGKLVFEKAGEVAVEFDVEGMGDQADPHASHGG